MPLILIRKDITTMAVDAVVNAANESLLGGGGVDGAIHAAAGPELLKECRGLGGCRPGEAKLTGGYRLKAKYIIHTVGPRWKGGGRGEEETLRSCYRSSLALAAEKGCESLAFPLISAGIFGYPRAEGLAVAEEEITRFPLIGDMTVYLCFLGREFPSREGFPELASLLQPPAPSFLTGAARPFRERRAKGKTARRQDHGPGEAAANSLVFSDACAAPMAVPMAEEEAEEAAELKEALAALDESFSEMLLRKITEKGMTDAECYKRANIDRKHFSKIRSDRHYRPGKATVLAFAVALELGLGETRELLMKAGFALSRSSEFDVIVEYFISRGQYDICRINEALFAFDQPLLGC